MSAASGRITILHLSDVHATDGTLLYDAVDGLARLEQVGDYAIAAGITPEVVLVTGDLIERGHDRAYPALADALERLSTRLRAPVMTVVGNHDTAAVRDLPEHALGTPAPGAITADRIRHVGELRLALLDSSSGRLDPAQLDWLREQLAQPHGVGTVIALHHPPVPSPLPSLAQQALADGDALMRSLEGTDVRLVLSGHFHHAMSASAHGIPISVGPSLVYQQVMDAGRDRVSGGDDAMFSLIHLTGASVSTSAVRLTSPSPLFTKPVVVPA